MNIKKLKYFSFLHSLIIFIILLFCYNNVEAKDIEIHSTHDEANVVFYMKTGASNQSTSPWTYYDSATHTPVKEYGNDIMASIPTGRLRSYSYIIHNTPFSKYESTNNKSDYGYVTSFDSNTKTKYTKILARSEDESKNDNYIEFARLSIKHATQSYNVNGETNYVDVQCNVIPKSYLNKIRENKDKLKSGIVGSEYMFYLSEPIAVRESNGTKHYSTRSVFENDEQWHDRNVGYLCASTIVQNNLLSNFGNQYRQVSVREHHHFLIYMIINYIFHKMKLM